MISYDRSVASDYCVWLVDTKGQQAPEASAGNIRVETRSEAEDAAHEIAKDTHGRVFIVEEDSGEWDRVLSHV